MKIFNLSVTCIFISFFALPVYAINLNYESLSSLEKPLAAHFGDTTFTLNGVVDAAVDYDSDTEDNESSSLTNFEIAAETQLRNSWTLGVGYFGQYTDSDFVEEDYTDNAAVFLGGVWGTVSIGNVTGMLREETRRIRGAGNAALNLDGQLGQLDDTGLTYMLRLGPTRFLATVDEEEGFEIATIYQRPIGNKDYRFSLRYHDSESAMNNSANFDSEAFIFVAELIYGSTVWNAGLGFEELGAATVTLDRQYLSVGATHKVGVLTFSGEAHVGDIDGQDETAYAIGLSYDIARGISLNLGVNHTDVDANFAGGFQLSQDQTISTVSLRYSF